MIMGNLKEALVSMGYRKLDLNKPFWLKPFCFSVIAVRVENNHVIMRLLYNYNNVLDKNLLSKWFTYFCYNVRFVN